MLKLNLTPKLFLIEIIPSFNYRLEYMFKIMKNQEVVYYIIKIPEWSIFPHFKYGFHDLFVLFLQTSFDATLQCFSFFSKTE